MMIDFKELGMPVFTGRQRGRDARKKIGLDNIKDDERCTVLIPEDVYTITSSYFLGLFGPSVRSLGQEAFFERFTFQAPEHIRVKLQDFVVRALRDQGNLFP